MKGIGVGGIYGPQAGKAGILNTYPVELFHKDRFLHETGPGLVTGSAGAAGVQVGQFTFSQMTVGLLLLLGLIWWEQNRK